MNVKIFSPSDQQKLLGEYSEVVPQESDLIAAKAKQLTWSSVSFDQRLKAVNEMALEIEQDALGLRSFYAEETGRSMGDVDLEWAQFANWRKRFQEDRVALTEMQGAPVGNVLTICPAVWPVLFGFSSALLALLTGNSAWIKASESGAISTLKLLNHLQKRFPDFPLYGFVGDSEVSRKFALSPFMDTVIFYGSTEVGSRLRQEMISQPYKELALNMGCKNMGWIHDSAEISPENLDIIFDSSFRANGYHCRAVNIFLIPAAKAKLWADAIYGLAKGFPVGDPSTFAAGVRGVGPLPNASLVDRYLKLVGMIEREGAEVLMRGKSLDRKTKGHFVAPTVALFSEYSPERFRKSIVQQTELLGPMIQLVPYSSEAEVLEYYDVCHYGLVSLALGKGHDEKVLSSLPVGCVVWDRATLKMDFSKTLIARKKSGAGSVQGIGLARRLSRKTFIER